MEINRKLRISTITKRRFLIARSSAHEPMSCPQCGSAMLEPKEAAVCFGIEQREIFQMIESDKVHFIEREHGSVFVCLSPLIGRDDRTDRRSAVDRK